ncbi:MAG: phage holin family protein [Dehalococcoidia bacterium]
MEASETQQIPDPNGDERSIGDLVSQISESASTLIREEIELARTEIETKIRRIVQGAVIAGAAGFFVLLGLIFVFQSMAWGVTDWFFPKDIWLGFLVTTGLLFFLAGLSAFIAYRAFKAGAPPIPDQAIDEARLIKEALDHPDVQAAVAAEDGATSENGNSTKES